MIKPTLYLPDSMAASIYRQRWLAALTRLEGIEKSRDKWREATCSAIVVAIVLVVVCIMQAMVHK